MVAQCSAYESSGGAFAELGTDRHAALKAHYAGEDSLLDLLDDEDQQGIRWAADYIRANTTESHPTVWETKLKWMRPDFSDAEGTPDVVNGLDIFDFKWRARDYTAQMADYASSLIQSSSDIVTVHILFGAERRAEKLKFDNEACEKIVLPILEKPIKETPCDYCGWCAKRLTCKALTGPAKVVAEGYAEATMLEVIKSWHPSEMLNDAAQLAYALTICRKVLKPWCDSVEFHAKEGAIKNGLQLPGYELKSKRGRQFVPDVKAAFEATGLDATEFLQACDVRLNTSKTTGRKGLDTIFKDKFSEASLAAAKRTVQKKLGDCVQRAKETLELKSVKGGDEEETE
jgi:hypothetical protein